MNTNKNNPRIDEGQGRTHNEDGTQPQGKTSGAESNDISAIDQQEGTMANGEVGDVDTDVAEEQ